MAARISYDLVAVVAKPLDIINAREFAMEQGISDGGILWICSAEQLETAERARSVLAKHPAAHVVYVPLSGYAHSHPIARVLAKAGRMGRLFLLGVFSPVFSARWWWLHQYGRKVFGSGVRARYFACDPTAAKLLFYMHVDCDDLVFFDGGRSTVTWKRDRLFGAAGGFALLRDALTRRAFMFPTVFKRRIYKKIKQEPVFFSCYPVPAQATYKPVPNEYRRLKSDLTRGRGVGNWILVLGSPGRRAYALAELADTVRASLPDAASDFFQIRYRPHPREAMSASDRQALIDQRILLMSDRFGVELDLLEANSLPRAVVGWGSSGLDVLRHALPREIPVIDLWQAK